MPPVNITTFEHNTEILSEGPQSEAILPMPEFLAAILKDYIASWRPNPLRLLFVNQRGKPYNGENVIRDRLAPLLGQLGIERAGFHAFRHTHTSLLLEAGEPPTAAQAQLRHSDPRITLGIYGHVLGEAQRNAVEKVAEVLRPTAPKSEGAGKWIQ